MCSTGSDYDGSSSIGYEGDSDTCTCTSLTKPFLGSKAVNSNYHQQQNIYCYTAMRSNNNGSYHRDQGPRSPVTSSPVAYRVGELDKFIAGRLAAGDVEIKLCGDGEGGTYFISPTATSAQNGPAKPPIAVWKPACEEIGCPGNPKNNTELDRLGFKAGDGFKREALAADLDYGHFASVPETVVMTIDGKEGSAQRFIPGTRQSWDMGPAKFSPSAVHRIGIFDIRTLNGDRHGGNMLVPDADPTMLVPIDHSYILPEGFADPEFEWMDWPQAKLPFTQGELEYIARLDAVHDQQLVTERLGEEAGETIAVTTRVLKIAASRGYNLKEIAHFCRRETLTQPSRLELIMAECRSDETLAIDTKLVEEHVARAFPPK